jgi:hypothetical protein
LIPSRKKEEWINITRLFQGEYSNWSELGGADLPIETAYLASTLESGIILLCKEFTGGENGKLDEKAIDRKFISVSQ